MTRHSKIGIVAAAAVVLAFAAFGFGQAKDASAHARSLSASGTCSATQVAQAAFAGITLSGCAAVGSLTTVTGSWIDDEAAPHTLNASATFTATGVVTVNNLTGSQVGIFTNLTLTNSDQCVAVSLCGVGTDVVTVPDDTDTVSETITARLTFLCDINGIEQIDLAEGDGTAPSGNTLTIFVGCGTANAASGAPASFLAKVSNQDIESVPAPSSTNAARIDVEVFDSSGRAVPLAHVHFIVTQGSITVGNGLPTDDSVVEPDAFGEILASTANLGSTLTGDSCGGGSPVGAIPTGPAPDIFSMQTANAVSDAFGEVSACYFASFPGAPTAAPGPVVVTILVDRPGVESLTGTVTITVVGPPFAITVTARPTSLTCGENAVLTASVKDSVGQKVSDQTRVDFVTNLGGVLAGSGLSLGSPLIGPVSPLSSTSVETFGGVATAVLVTSEVTTGPYVVVATSGGTGLGGVFSTRPVVAQVTVNCARTTPVPVPATVTAPRTGTGIAAPNTGDAGLVGSSSSTNWTLYAIGGAFALALAGLATFKFARR